MEYTELVERGRDVFYVVSGVSLVISFLIVVIHSIKVSSFRDHKEKYDYLRKKDARMRWLALLFFSISGFFLLNTFEQETVLISSWWFLVRTFVSLCIATLIAYVGYLVLKFYFPGRLQKRLDKLRYTPRISSSGNVMNLLSEAEEDVYLDEGMQAEEDVFSVDYDVWVDDSTKEVKIEKYPGYLEVLKCGTCNFQTLKLKKEEIVSPATETSPGELMKHYECTFCKSRRVTKHPIHSSVKSETDFRLPEDYRVKSERRVKSIMMEVISTKGERAEFYFQGIDEAQKFLDEFDFNKIPENQIEQ